MAVAVNPEVSGMWWKEIVALGRALDETLDEMGKASVAFFTDDRRAFQDFTYTRFSSSYPTLAAVGRQDQDHASQTFSTALAALTGEAIENSVRNFGAFAYFSGRPVDDAVRTVRQGIATLRSNENAEEKALAVAAFCGLASQIAGLFLMGASPRPPLTLTTTTIPTDISMTMGAAAGHGAMAPALAMSVSTVAAPAVSAEGAAAVAGILTGPTVMYAAAQTKNDDMQNIDPDLERSCEYFEKDLADQLWREELRPGVAPGISDLNSAPEIIRYRFKGEAEIAGSLIKDEVFAQAKGLTIQRTITIETESFLEKTTRKSVSKGYIDGSNAAQILKHRKCLQWWLDHWAEDWNDVFSFLKKDLQIVVVK